ncbi:MAG TPA: NrfD/PsrC family molybdoenzyme membrane anchor subunit [Stellaceae bacterium]|nr:NrfD/PsrC family molybdoenzyme membrane anchor subunit [Stellaceae bacterium]
MTTLINLPPDAPIIGPGVNLARLNEEIAGRVLSPRPPLWWTLSFGFSLLLVIVLVVAMAWVFVFAVGTWGINIPVAWGLAIAEYVWWTGLAAGAMLLSALFYVTGSPWRPATQRIAEAAVLGSLAAGGIMPILHLGRQGLFYWNFPYSTVMAVWPNFLSPLLWDFVSILCFVVSGVFFYYIGILPDLASLRDMARAPRKQFLYGLAALGWRGSARQWQSHRTAYELTAAVMAALVISVHGVVGLDFAGGLTPGWHSTQFPPYFFFGAVLSGTGLVLMLAIGLRHAYNLQDIITGYHLNILAKLVLVGSLLLVYSYLWEGFGAIYGSDIAVHTMYMDRLTGFYAPAFWARLALNAVIPQLLWLPIVRRSEILLVLISLGAVIGMWLEPYMIVVQSLHRDYMPSYWGEYWPTFWDWATLAGSVGLFLVIFLLLIRLVPVVSMFQMRQLVEEARPQ